jgi:hypothetical protein
MSKEHFENEFHSLTNLLVARGLAKSTFYDTKREVATVEWTPDGLALQRLLRQLFDVPNVSIHDLPDRHIADFIAVVLSAAQRNPVR